MKRSLILLFAIINTSILFSQRPFLYSPLKDAILTDLQVTFTWKDNPSFSQYIFQIDSDSLFPNPAESTLTSTSLVMNNLTPGKYWWRVKGNNDVWSVKYNFRIVNMHSWGGLSLWYRADSGVTVVNGLVSQWKDQSDSNRVATQANSNTQASFVEHDINGLPSIAFGKSGAIGQHTFMTFNPISFGTQYTFLSIYRPLANSLLFQYFIAGPRGIYIRGSGPRQLGSTDLTSGFYTSGEVQQLWGVWSLRHGSIRRGQTNLTISNVSTGNPSLALSNIGHRPDLIGDQFLHARVPEFLFFSQILPDSLRNLGERYLISKYARPVKLQYDTNACASQLVLSIEGGTEEYSSILWSNSSTSATTTITSNGTYWVRATSRLGNVITTDTIRVYGIFSQPQITPNTGQVFCFERDTVTFSRLSNAPGVIYTWFNGSTDSSISLTAGSKVYLVANDPIAGCVITSDTVSMTHKTKADFANPASCPGINTVFTNLSIDLLNDTVNTWQWNFGDPTTTLDVSYDTSGTWIYSSSGTYPVYLKVTTTDGCSDSIVKNVIIKPTAVPNFNWQGLCYGKPTQFFDQSTPEIGTQITGYQWNFGPGITSSFVNPAVVFDTANSYPVSLRVFTASGCNEIITLQVPVNKGVNAAFSISDTLCAKQLVDAIDQSQGVNDNITNWVWRFGSNAPINGQNPNFAFQGTGNRVVRLTTVTAAGCSDSVQKTVLVKPAPEAAFSFVVNGGNPPFTPVVINQSQDADLVNWNYGQGFSDTSYNPILPSFADTGTYMVTLAVQNNEGCTDTVSHNFVVFTGDRTLQLISATCTPDGEFMRYTARVLNKGALEVDQITFGANTDYNSVIKENWNGVLMPGQILDYSLKSSSKYYTEANFCCVRIDNFNDTLTVQSPDDEICLPFTNEAWFSAAYPTPTTGFVTVDFSLPFAGSYSAKLVQLDGKEIRSLFTKQNVSAGFGSFKIDISDLDAGMYIIRINYRDKNHSIKLIKQ